MRDSLDSKVKLTKNICLLMNREDDEHLRADLYRLTNQSLEKLVRDLEAKSQGQRIFKWGVSDE